MANYDDLVSRVAIHVSPCPEKVILDAVREVVRDFCMKTKGWVHDCPAIEVNPTQLYKAFELILIVPSATVNDVLAGITPL